MQQMKLSSILGLVWLWKLRQSSAYIRSNTELYIVPLYQFICYQAYVPSDHYTLGSPGRTYSLPGLRELRLKCLGCLAQTRLMMFVIQERRAWNAGRLALSW